ncbi:hypothetical protein HYH03_018110 [Edaphochlamys debaryana]|uniref:procollagen-lysine 5-dioxygenase n=1 Tax=Edaphochlamys debaryana TaxID=47281 RepID=A0A835XGJ6_9CHLO|nr:hypothetical protein HYH03_018110 [Edaphochlamys debaryana]|eukprot:KAG2482984.1 hypothetical protein HYH03_018110 [Edaphochlamys debaryana]
MCGKSGTGTEPPEEPPISSGQEGQPKSDVPGGVRLVGGACIIDEFIAPELLEASSQEAQDALAEGSRQAAVGGAVPSSEGRAVDVRSRGDTMRWLTAEAMAESGHSALEGVVRKLEGLRQQLEKQGYDVGGKPTFQLACYPSGGARYVRHADASVSCPTRTMTAIVYLNTPEWDPERDGGCLALYNLPYTGRLANAGLERCEPAAVVAPVGGRLVLFQSHLFHEVLPSHRHRYAITAWFHLRPPHSGPPPPAPRPAAPLPLPTPAPRAPTVPPVAPPAASAPPQHDDAPLPFASVSRPDSDTPSFAARFSASGRMSASGRASSSGRAWMPRSSGRYAGGRGMIFVSIAAYRDPEAQWTLHSLFSQAHEPDRIRVGIVWQVHPIEDADLMRVAGARSHPEWLSRVRQVVLPHMDAEGPCKARALAQAMWSGEEYVLQLDSHMRMVPGWDTLAIGQLGEAEAASSFGKAVLSTYPLPYEGEGPAASVPEPDTAPATLLCAGAFAQDGFLRTVGRTLRQRPAKPLRSGLWAAGLSFARADWLKEVPYCPHLPHLFFGEEPYMLARMWTRGYDTFAPSVPLAFHAWDRSARVHTYQRDLLPTPTPAPGASSGPNSGADVSTGSGTAGGLRASDRTGSGMALGETGVGWGLSPTLEEEEEGREMEVARKEAAVLRRRSQARVLAVLSGGAATGAGEDGVGPDGCGDPGVGGEASWGVGGVWGLGRVRTLQQLAEAVGVDFAARVVDSRAAWGGLGEDAFEA